jgi:hypothetical protein
VDLIAYLVLALCRRGLVEGSVCQDDDDDDVDPEFVRAFLCTASTSL